MSCEVNWCNKSPKHNDGLVLYVIQVHVKIRIMPVLWVPNECKPGNSTLNKVKTHNQFYRLRLNVRLIQTGYKNYVHLYFSREYQFTYFRMIILFPKSNNKNSMSIWLTVAKVMNIFKGMWVHRISAYTLGLWLSTDQMMLEHPKHQSNIKLINHNKPWQYK